MNSNYYYGEPCSVCKCILAGLDMETTIKLCEIINKYPYPDIYLLLRAINYQNYNALAAFNELTNKCRLESAWKRFILGLADELRIVQLVRWLNNKLARFIK